jgi:hypothetical protein
MGEIINGGTPGKNGDFRRISRNGFQNMFLLYSRVLSKSLPLLYPQPPKWTIYRLNEPWSALGSTEAVKMCFN